MSALVDYFQIENILCKLLVVEWRLSAMGLSVKDVGCWLRGISAWSSTAGFWLLSVWGKLLKVGFAVGCHLMAVLCRYST